MITSTGRIASLNITYEMTNPWIDTAPTGLLPADGSTLWNTSTPRPSGAILFRFLTPSSSGNESGFMICRASDARMTTDLECISSSDTLALEEANYTWDPVNNTSLLRITRVMMLGYTGQCSPIKK